MSRKIEKLEAKFAEIQQELKRERSKAASEKESARRGKKSLSAEDCCLLRKQTIVQQSFCVS